MTYPWQQKQWELIQRARRSHRLPHALLLTGAEGLGKVDFARELAGSVLCETDREQACGECQACIWFSAGTHPDLFTVTLQEKSKVVKIDQIRALNSALQKTAHKASGYQVVILYPAQTMHPAAANALLKTLEEPPGAVLFILIANQLAGIPATIHSRCQRLHFHPANPMASLNWLQDKLASLNLNHSDAKSLLALADGAPLSAVVLAEQDYPEMCHQVMAHLKNSRAQQINPIEPVESYVKKDALLYLKTLASLANDMIKIKLAVIIDRCAHVQQYNLLTTIVEKLSIMSLQLWRDNIQQAQQLLQRPTHVNPQLLLEDLFIQWGRLPQA